MLSLIYIKKKSMIFRAFLGANIAASLYSFFFVCLPPKSLLWRLAIVLDVVINTLLHCLLMHFFLINLYIGMNKYNLIGLYSSNNLLDIYMVFLSCKIMFGLLVAMDSAAIAAAYLHKHGDSQAFWPPICSQVPTYCYRVILAISIGFGGVFMFLLIIIISISVILNPLLV